MERQGFLFRARGRRTGMALVLVVMVLSSMLLLGTVFMHNIRLDYEAAVNYARTGQAEMFALEGMHRAMAEVMYDIWGVDEDRAFACTPEWGQLTKGVSAGGVLMRSAYAYDGSEQIVSARAYWRRTLSPVSNGSCNVETDFRWVDRDTLDTAAPPTQYGGYYWDEFLPEGGDNADLFEASLMLNHGPGTDRDYARDDDTVGGVWTGGFWPANNGGPQPPWDYVDMRIAPDSMMHVFRFDLLDPRDFRVRSTGVRDQDPKRPIPSPRSDPDYGATHLGTAADAGWPDVWGGALNINQVNNNYKWELYYNWKPYPGVPQWSEHHFREAKWINIYDLAGDKVIGRYAVTVVPDSGLPNPNYMHDGRLGARWAQYLETTALYLKSLDQAWTPHGLFAGGKNASPDTPPDKIKSKTLVDPPPGYADWYHGMTTRFAQHRDEHGIISTRAELSMLVRKWGFDPNDVSEEELTSDARIISAMVSPSSYEYALGPHWEKDRVVVDVGASGLLFSGPSAVNAYRKALDGLQYYWGPDRRNGSREDYTDAVDPETRWTPFHENDPAAPSPASDWDRRARRAKAVSLAWMMANTEHEGHVDRSLVAVDKDDFDYINKPTQAQMQTGRYETVVMNPLINVSEVGRFIPVHPTKDEHANGDGSIGGEGEDVGFDPADPKEYYFVELAMYWAYDARDIAKTLPRGAAILVNGKDVLLDPRTRLVGRNGYKPDGRNYMIPPNDPNLYGPSWPGRGGFYDWSYDDLCIMVAPSNHSNPAVKSNIGLVTGVSHDRDAYSFADAHFSSYITIYFPAEPAYDGDEVLVAWNGVVVDRAELPGRISALRPPPGPDAGFSYSAMFYADNGVSGCWQANVPATPAWSRRFTDAVGTRWMDGQNVNYFPQAWPENRVDINNVSRRMSPGRTPSHIAAGRSVVMRATRHHYPFARAQELRAAPLGFASEVPFDTLASVPGLFDASGAYSPYGVADPVMRTWLLHHVYDADLLSWHDLMRVTPLERLFTVGYLRPWGMGPLVASAPSVHTLYPLFDGVDNNLDGLIDDLTAAPLSPLGSPGYYLGDRAGIGRVNVNSIFHPSAVFYAASYANWNPTVQIGRKPLKGYNSLEEWETRLLYYQSDSTPYDKIVWYENLFADCSSDNYQNRLQGHLDTEMEQTAAIAYAGTSPVFTLYITAQTVSEDPLNPAGLFPSAEIKIRATIERTWDGKLNVIEFNWIPQDLW